MIRDEFKQKAKSLQCDTFSTIVWLFENTEGKDDVIQNSSGDYLQSIKPTLI